jgi:hypothetical protein
MFLYRPGMLSGRLNPRSLGSPVKPRGEQSMVSERKLFRSLAVVATLAMYVFMTQTAAAKGGGHGGGGHHGGGHHGGGHHAGHHGGGHNHHAYHPSHHHSSHHASHHHDGHHDHHHDHHHTAHHNHHHSSWHHGGWGPGYWGAAGIGAGLGYAYGNWGDYGYGGGGDTYVDNSTDVTPVSNETASDDSADDGSADGDSNSSDDSNAAAGNNAGGGFPTDDWPELGVVTYAGQYGGSQGQVIVRVVPGSGADKAGLVPGDVILTFNGKPVPSADDLDEALDTAGGKFDVSVWDARTGRKSALDGELDPKAISPPATETAAVAPAQQ